MIVLGFGLSPHLARVRTLSLPLLFTSMLAEHSTPWPSWRMGNIVLDLPYYLQAKGLSFSHSKRDVTMQARTCNPRVSPSKVRRFTSEPPRHLLALSLPSFSDDEITSSYLVKRDVHGWDRSGDLGSHGPAWSRRAVEASEGSDVFRGLEYCSSSSLYCCGSLSGPPQAY